MLETIKQNVRQYGFHAYEIAAGPCPRFSYTIGLRGAIGAELILAGGATFEANSPMRIIDVIARRILEESRSARTAEDITAGIFPVDGLGRFTLRKADDSWVRLMLLGALDYYDCHTVSAYQIVPAEEYKTLDVPNLSIPRSRKKDPAWRWLDESWCYPVEKDSLAMTNLLALRRTTISEAVRWEDGWHLYASQDTPVAESDLRLMPLGALLGADPSLEAVVHLKVGEALWRASEHDAWQPWDLRDGEEEDPSEDPSEP